MASFRELESNLKTFLIDMQSDAHNIKTMAASRYNNITISIKNKKNKDPHFTIKMGMSEATFDLNSCEKLNGGLGFEERFVRRWYDRVGIKQRLQECWDAEMLKA